jgi:hypothetical protein
LHLTNQHCLPAINKIVDKFEENDGAPPYTNIDEFMVLLGETGFSAYKNTMAIFGLHDWVVEHWDYFNPGINRQITLVKVD